MYYFWFSNRRKIRDTNLHTPPRRTIKRAEDILERLQIPLPPSCSWHYWVPTEDGMLHVFLAYAPILIHSVTLKNHHRGMTQFKSNLKKIKTCSPSSPLAPVNLCAWLTEFKCRWQVYERFPAPLLQSWAALNNQSHLNWRGGRYLVMVAPQRNMSPLSSPHRSWGLPWQEASRIPSKFLCPCCHEGGEALSWE